MTIRIKIFCPFASSERCKEIYEKINYSNELDFYGENKNIFFTEKEDYTHAILINTIMPKLTIKKQNVIGLAFEPIQFLNLTPNFIEYAQKFVGKYYIGDKGNLPEPFVEHFGYMWHSRPPKEITNKTKLMSIIVSEKQFAPGHKYRHQLVEQIIQNKLPIDIYGRGSSNYNYDRIMGIFNDAEPYENYSFSICIENFSSNHYFSEKILTPLMYNSTPIYWGCKNIGSYVENIIQLSGNIQEDIKLLISVISAPNIYYKKTYTLKNIKAINLIENIERLF